MDFDISINIGARPDQVWAVMSDVERWHEWTPSITSVEKLDPGPLAVGLRARVRQPKLPPAVWTVTWVEGGGGFTWISRAPGVLVSARHMIQAIAGGSRVRLSIAYAGFFGRLIGRLTKNLNRRYLGFEAEGLKRQCEVAGTTGEKGTR